MGLIHLYFNLKNKYHRFTSLRRDVELVGNSKVISHPATHILMKNSKIIIKNGTLNIGVMNLRGGGGFDPARDSCRIHLENSTLTIDGNVKLMPGSKIVGNNAKISIGDGTRVISASIYSELEVRVGKHCLLSRGVIIRDEDGHQISTDDKKPRLQKERIIIQDKCLIYDDAKIHKGVMVGEGSIVAAGAIVTKNVPKRTMVAGIPAKVIKKNVVWEDE